VPILTYNFKNSVTPDNCKYIIDYCESNYELKNARMGKEWETSIDNPKERITKVAFIDGTTEKDEDIRKLMHGFILEANDEFFNYDVRFFETIQFARYEGGGHYNWHQDYFEEMIRKDYPRCRKLSATLNLTPYNETGGHLEFFNGFNETEEEHLRKLNGIGTAIVFDSREWHRVTPIDDGIRYSLVCWSQGPHFK